MAGHRRFLSLQRGYRDDKLRTNEKQSTDCRTWSGGEQLNTQRPLNAVCITFFLDLNITDHLSHSFTHAISTHPSHLQHGPHLQSFQWPNELKKIIQGMLHLWLDEFLGARRSLQTILSLRRPSTPYGSLFALHPLLPLGSYASMLLSEHLFVFIYENLIRTWLNVWESAWACGNFYICTKHDRTSFLKFPNFMLSKRGRECERKS